MSDNGENIRICALTPRECFEMKANLSALREILIGDDGEGGLRRVVNGIDKRATKIEVILTGNGEGGGLMGAEKDREHRIRRLEKLAYAAMGIPTLFALILAILEIVRIAKG